MPAFGIDRKDFTLVQASLRAGMILGEQRPSGGYSVNAQPETWVANAANRSHVTTVSAKTPTSQWLPCEDESRFPRQSDWPAEFSVGF
jgi:hypothetical protein